MNKRILGIDTGTNSLGWAVVDRAENGRYTLVKEGVSIFQEGVKVEKGIESSKAAERTAHRALRKQYFRRRLRKIEVLKVLVKYGLCPAIPEDALKTWSNRKIYPALPEFMQWQRTDDKEDKNPYHDRHICLHEQLNLLLERDRYTLGRALYHLAQRRGFLSNRLDASEEDEESGKVKVGISNLSNEMLDAGFEYLGDYFYHLYHTQGNQVRIRTRYIDREQHYKHEFYAICTKQCLTPDMVRELERALYFQRPLKSQRQSVGKCTFEKGKPRCAVSHPLYEDFRKLSFVNNIKVRGPQEHEFRPLNDAERDVINDLFLRVSKPNFDFKEIAKKIAGKRNFYSREDAPEDENAYVFNYRMTQGVSNCPTQAALRNALGDDWVRVVCESYTMSQRQDGTTKTAEEMIAEVWNVLFSFTDKEHLKQFALDKLQLDESTAEKFSKIRLTRDYASLSLKAIRKILPFLEQGIIYSHAVFLANIPDLIGAQEWDAHSNEIVARIQQMAEERRDCNGDPLPPLDTRIKEYLEDEYGVQDFSHLYHPSMIEAYPDARPNHDGVVLLGSPRTNAVRNPMAMRSLHQVRRVINQLILDGIISPATEVHIEYARELNDANKRKAIGQYQKNLEKTRKKYTEEICALYLAETGNQIVPTDTDILKYQLWEEQDHRCLYTGDNIGISQFLGPSPVYDIEHTIPQSVGGDSTQENMTLCQSHFNRFIKKAQLPSQLANHEEIMERLESWRKKIEMLKRDIDHLSRKTGSDKGANDSRIQKRHLKQLEYQYWKGKYDRFTMTEVPEGFARRQGAGIGLISKYAGLFLKSYFHDSANPDRRQVYTVKGSTTAEFRRMWGLQDVYQKKSRDSHTHHCIDAIVIACIGKYEYAQMAHYYQAEEEYRNGVGGKPQFEKPWESFTQDVKALAEDLLVVHNTPDNMAKCAKKMVNTNVGKKMAQGDSVRASLHKDKYYGAIDREGDIRYVIRVPITEFKNVSELNSIVDDAVRETILRAVEGKNFSEAIAGDIWMNKEKGIRIKKVRCYASTVTNPLNIRRHRDVSPKEYKQQFHVVNDTNYLMAIYEKVEKGKAKRQFELVKAIDAARRLKQSQINDNSLVPEVSEKGFPLVQTLKVGTIVILYENDRSEIDFSNMSDLRKRMYKVTGMSSMIVSGCNYGTIEMKNIHEARPSKDVKAKNGAFRQGEEYRPAIKMLHTQIRALAEGQDFSISPSGDISTL